MIELLRQVLAELKVAGVVRAQVKVEGLDLSVELAPEIAPPPKGDPIEPGGWKSPRDLDAPYEAT